MRLSISLIALLLVTSLAGAADVDPDPDFDRMDGKGPSGKRVDVIEWEGNLEIHVYPGGSLSGLALKLDKANRDKPVMVIGYRFDNAPAKQLVRRAILGIELREGFHAYRDPSVSEYDKIIISNNVLSDSVVAFRLDTPPKQLYPEGHPANGTQSDGAVRLPAGKENPRQRPTSDSDGTITPFTW